MSVRQRKIRLTTAFLAALALSACGGLEDEDENKDPVEESGPVAINLQNEIPPASVGFGTTPSLPPSDHTFEGKHFSGSGACGVCHNDLIDDNGRDVSIGTAWETSTMANAARDPYWRAKAAATIKNYPHLGTQRQCRA